MKIKSIPEHIKEKVEGIISQFNKKTLKDQDCYYKARFKGKYLYLDRYDYGKGGPICRLTYIGKMDDWDFAIFKWSKEVYDPHEWMFPGSDLVNGTVDGAMKAGLKAYPIQEGFTDFGNLIDQLLGNKLS